MARGESGRIVIEIDPELKRRLYAALAVPGLTLKDWFILAAEKYATDTTQSDLFDVDESPHRVERDELSAHNLEADFAASELARQFVATPSLCYDALALPSGISATASFEISSSPWPKSDGLVSIIETSTGVQLNIALEYKRQAEGIHGVLTAIGQAQGYIHKGYHGAAIVVPRLYATHANPAAYVDAVLSHLGGCKSIGVFHYDAPDLTSSTPFHGRLHCVRPFDVTSTVPSGVLIAGRGATTQWVHTREGSTTRDAFFRFLQIAKSYTTGIGTLPRLNPDLVAAIGRIAPGIDPYWYLSSTSDNRFISEVWRGFWFTWVVTPHVLVPWIKVGTVYQTPNAFTEIDKDDGSGKSQIFEGRANGLKENLVDLLNAGTITEASAWEYFAAGMTSGAGLQNKQGIRDRAHSYREDLDSSLAKLNWIDELGRPTDFGYRFMSLCERYGGANTAIVFEYVGATMLQTGRFAAFLHYVHRLSEEIFTANPLAYTRQDASGKAVFDETSYFDYLADIEDKLTNDLKVMRKAASRGRPRTRTTFQAELTLLRNHGFVSPTKYRLGVGLPIQWEKVIEALNIEL